MQNISNIYKPIFWALGAAFILLLANCSNKKTILETPPLEVYFPLTPGKYITYRLDSTALTQFGRDTTVRSYRVRDEIDAAITDATGRQAYRVIRRMSNATGTAPFLPSYTFMAIKNGEDWIEWVENNLRFMKLRFPIREGFTWKGNSFIETTTLGSSVRFLFDWNYTYTNVGEPATINGKTYDNTLTVLQRDENIPEGPFNPQFFKQIDYSVEIYAAGIGLVYKNFGHFIWQPPTPLPENRPGFWEDGSYRVVLTAIDHN